LETKDPQTYEIIGAAMEVHATLGHGFLESIYHDALCRELTLRGIPFRREVPFAVLYKGEPLESTFRVDLLCYDDVVIELKALEQLAGKHEQLLLNYLKVTGLKRGLMLNFGAPRLETRRMVLGYDPYEL
jgi:GxxExxY protein